MEFLCICLLYLFMRIYSFYFHLKVQGLPVKTDFKGASKPHSLQVTTLSRDRGSLFPCWAPQRKLKSHSKVDDTLLHEAARVTESWPHSIKSEKISCWQMPARVDPVNILEAEYLQVHRLYVARPTTLIRVGRHFKNTFKTALTKVLLHSARFLEEEVVCFGLVF